MDSKISELEYITSYKSILERLKIEVKNLKDKKNSVQYTVDTAMRKGEKVVKNVQIWLKRVDETIDEANGLIFMDFHANYLTYIPNIRFRHQHSKNIQKMTQEIRQVLAEGDFDRISKPSTLQEIQQVLKDPNIYKIGLYGHDGVGKTTLIQELAREVEKDGSFDAVAMAEVTDSPDMENIQSQIANALGLKFDEETKEERVEKLRQRIIKKNILVILDDIWGKLDLEEVGIPLGDDHKGCKLLLTSEHPNVLKKMGTQKDFRLEVLSDEDSWKLFEKIASNDIKLTIRYIDYFKEENINSIIQNVPKCCNGLPLFIVVIAKALRRKNVSTWKDALKQLKGLDEKGYLKEVVCPLELGYRYLESDELRTLFLFIVSLGPGRIHTGELFSCCWGLYGNSHTLTEARNKYYKLIDDLRASSLLLEVEIEYVRMHDTVRDTAKEIASRTHLTYEVTKFTQKEQWDKDQLKKCHYINLPSYNMDELPEKLDSPELKLMSLRSNLGHLTIPDNFFVGMVKVKVLNLHGMSFAPSPPPSLLVLTNLISLNLYECVLEDIMIITELTSLEILSLERSKIQELPKEIGKLAHLRMLNLTNCSQLKTIPTNLLSSLTCLEELYMGNCNIQWDAEGGKGQTNHASLGELRNLNLTTLDLSIHDASVLPADMDVFEQLQRYNIFIGNMWKWSSLWSGDAREISRTLKLVDSLNTQICLNRGVQMLFTTIEDLSLAKLNFANDASYELNGKTFKHLRHLYVQNSDAFRNLGTLILCNLCNMEDISYGPLATQCFEKLKVFKVQECGKLKKLLLYSVAKNLSQLQEMEIFKCEVMEKIISEEKLEDENLNLATHSLEKLQVIKVQGCDKLKKLLPYSLAKNLSQLQKMEILNCNFMDEIIYEEKLENGNLHNMEDISYCPLSTHSFENLQVIIVQGCDMLKKILLYSLAKNLFQLQEMEISHCKAMEEIISEEEVEDGKEFTKIVLPKLHSLTLNRLPKLRSFSLPLETDKDDGSIPMPLFNQKVTFPELDMLVIINLNLKSIWYNQQAPNSLNKLKKIKITGCHALHHVFPTAVVKELLQLQVLEICKSKIEMIVEENYSQDAPGTIAFTKLEQLKLEDLPRLTSIFQERYNLDFPSLQTLEVIGCPNWRGTFPELDMLVIINLNLKSIWYNQQAPNSLNKLKKIKITRCHAPHHVFPTAVVKELLQLQVLEICKSEIEMIVEENYSQDAPGTIAFTKLEQLKLEDLPRLTSIFQERYNLDFPSLQTLEVIGCPNWKSFGRENLTKWRGEKGQKDNELNNMSIDFAMLNEKVAMPNLENLRLFKVGSHKKIWDKKRLIPFYSKNLRDLILNDYCNPTESLFSFSAARALTKLKHLEILACPDLVQIFIQQEEVTFTNLETLFINDMNGLQSIWNSQQAPNSFCKLNKIQITGCHALQHVFPVVVTFPNLETLFINDMNGLQSIWNRQQAPNSFCKLNKIQITGCHALQHVFPVVVTFPNLETLFINDMNGLQSIWNRQQAPNSFCKLNKIQITGCHALQHVFPVVVTFPNLETLFINDMNGLQSIWNSQQAPSSFCKLNKIQITGCHALQHVFPVVVAKELQQLQVLEISMSIDIENIVGGDKNKGDEEVEIVFMKLKELHLERLLNLRSFCKESYNFNFPALENVRVIRCLNMKTFCHGNLIAPCLSKVQFGGTSQADRWHDDLNTTIKRYKEI